MTKKVLLHVCCAPCAAYCIESLQKLGYDSVLYFYNPNIHLETEYLKRLKELEKYADELGCELFVGEYKPDEFYAVVKGFELEPEKGLRCEKCFNLRLKKTMDKAQSLGIEDFTTSLTISPHKNSKTIFAVAKEVTKNKVAPKFLEIDFKKNNGFLKSTLISKTRGFYKQSYCGCEYSLRSSTHQV